MNKEKGNITDTRDFLMFAVRNSQQYGIGKICTHKVFACEIRMRTQCGTAFTVTLSKKDMTRNMDRGGIKKPG